MSGIVDFQAERSRLEHMRKDKRTSQLKDDFRTAREAALTQEESTRRLLAIFRRKPPPER